jgi:hypothetical protein
MLNYYNISYTNDLPTVGERDSEYDINYLKVDLSETLHRLSMSYPMMM